MNLIAELIAALRNLRREKKSQYQRCLPLPELLNDRSEKAQFLGFGEGTTAYDSAIVLGHVQVGKDTWIGPNVMLDGSGGLSIGSNCSVSANVQIYSHDTVQWAISGGKEPYEYEKTTIGNNCYIGPNTVIQKGVSIGEGVVIGANSFVNIDLPSHCKAVGSPIRIIAHQNDV